MAGYHILSAKQKTIVGIYVTNQVENLIDVRVLVNSILENKIIILTLAQVKYIL